MKRKIKNRMTVLNATQDKASLYLYGDIGETWFGEGITDKRVLAQLDEIKASEIDVHINSNGGDVFQGIAIGNVLKNHKAKINIVIDGIAASAASVIAMAGDKIKMYANSQLMIHNAWTVAMGNAKDLRKVADDLDKINSSVVESYKEKFNGSDDELLNLLDSETYLTADESLAYGLADEILGAKTKSDGDEDSDDEKDTEETDDVTESEEPSKEPDEQEEPVEEEHSEETDESNETDESDDEDDDKKTKNKMKMMFAAMISTSNKGE